MEVITVIPITLRKVGRDIYPNEVLISLDGQEAIILCHQIRTISKQRLNKKFLSLDPTLKHKVLKTLYQRF